MELVCITVANVTLTGVFMATAGLVMEPHIYIVTERINKLSDVELHTWYLRDANRKYL